MNIGNRKFSKITDKIKLVIKIKTKINSPIPMQMRSAYINYQIDVERWANLYSRAVEMAENYSLY